MSPDVLHFAKSLDSNGVPEKEYRPSLRTEAIIKAVALLKNSVDNFVKDPTWPVAQVNDIEHQASALRLLVRAGSAEKLEA